MGRSHQSGHSSRGIGKDDIIKGVDGFGDRAVGVSSLVFCEAVFFVGVATVGVTARGCGWQEGSD